MNRHQRRRDRRIALHNNFIKATCGSFHEFRSTHRSSAGGFAFYSGKGCNSSPNIRWHAEPRRS